MSAADNQSPTTSTTIDEYTQLGRRIEIKTNGCEISLTSWNTKLAEQDLLWGSATFDLRGALLTRHRNLVLLATIAASKENTFFKDGSDVLWDKNIGGSFNGTYLIKMRPGYEVMREQNIKRQAAYDTLHDGDGQSFVVFSDNELARVRKGDGGAEGITRLETLFHDLQNGPCKAN